MLDPATKSQFETLVRSACIAIYVLLLPYYLTASDMLESQHLARHTLELDVLNKRKRTPLMLCFSPPHFTLMAKTWGLEQDDTTGLAVQRVKRPLAAVSEQDWVKPGGRKQRENCVRMLTAAGANVNALDMHGYSCLHYAAMLGWHESVEMLLTAGADASQKCLTGETALLFAIEKGHGAAAETLLLAVPTLVDESDKDGIRAIHTAIRCKRGRQFLELLADFKADLNSPDYTGVTPLHLACSLQDWEAVNVLLDLKVAKDDTALALLEGEASDRIQQRLKNEEAERARLAALENGDMATDAQRLAQRAHGQWVPYIDKGGKGIFYYNKVSRESRWDVPPDYTKDKAHTMKTVTFGMSFYH
eukprot:3499-Heterococcus_DN1.PRE.3